MVIPDFVVEGTRLRHWRRHGRLESGVKSLKSLGEFGLKQAANGVRPLSQLVTMTRGKGGEHGSADFTAL